MDVRVPEVARYDPIELRGQFEGAGVKPGPASLPVEFRRDEQTYRRDLAELPRLAAFAAALGVKTMFRSIPASSQVPAAELLITLQRRVTEMAGILRENGLDFALEPLGPLHRRQEGPHEFIWRFPDAAEFAASCGAVLLVDSWHWHHADESIESLVSLGGMIRHVHVADAPDLPPEEIRDESRLLPGQGVINHATFLEALDVVGYNGFISPEVRGYACDANPVDCARSVLVAVCDLGTGDIDAR